MNFHIFLQKRIDVFVELLGKGDVTKVNVDTTNTEALIRLLDTVVIKLEGGSDDDLKVLDEKPIVINTIQPKIIEEKPKPVVDEKAKNEENVENVSEKKDDTPKEVEVEESTKSKKRRRTHSDSSSSSDSSSDSDNSDNEKSKAKPEENGNGVEKDDNEQTEDGEEKDEQQSQQTEEKDVDMEKSSDENKELQESEKEPEKIEVDKVDEVVDLDKDDDEEVKNCTKPVLFFSAIWHQQLQKLKLKR